MTRLCPALLLSLLSLPTLITIGWTAPRQPRAHLTSCTGSVSIQRGGQGQWVVVGPKTDHALYPGDHLRTGDGAKATVVMDGAKVSLGPRTTVKLDGGTGKLWPVWVSGGKVLIRMDGARPIEIGTAGAIATSRDAAPSQPSRAASLRPAKAYAAEITRSLQALIKLLPEYSRAADAFAAQMARGGTVWLAGDKGFVLEHLNRAGGLMACKWLTKPEEMKSGDVMLYGLVRAPSPEDRDFMSDAAKAGVLCLTLCPAPDDAWAGRYLPVPAPPADDPQRLPTISPVLAAAGWTFTAELIAALTRQGRLPPMYQSVLVPGARERNAEHLKLKWEPQAPPPIKAGVLGRTYLARLTNCWRTLQATQLDGFGAAGRLAAEAVRAGHTAWYGSLGHLPPELPGQTGDPGVLKPLKMAEPTKLADFVKPGDVILYVGYYEPYGPWVEQAHALGARIVTVVSGTPERRAEDMGAEINLNGCWPFGDALLEIPGYDVKVVPPSGVIQSAAYWLLVAETAAALK